MGNTTVVALVVVAIVGCGGKIADDGSSLRPSATKGPAMDPVDDAAGDDAGCTRVGAPAPLVKDPTPWAELHWLAADQSHVYWIESRSGALRRIAKLGGPTETIATLSRNGGLVPAVLLDDGVMWAGQDSVMLTPKSGGPSRALFPLPPPASSMGWVMALAGDAAQAFAVISVPNPDAPALLELTKDTPARPRTASIGKLALDATSVYFRQVLSPDGGVLVKQPKAGGPIVTLAPGCMPRGESRSTTNASTTPRGERSTRMDR
jgi:hypothetical protein